MKLTLRLFGILGILLFGTGLALTFKVPGFVEEIGKDFIKQRIADETNEKIENIKFKGKAIGKNSKIGKLTDKFYNQHVKEINDLKTKLKNNLHGKIVQVIAEMGDLDCDCRDKYAQKIKSGLEFKIVSLQKANKKISNFMKIQYMEIVHNLKNDFRIFTGINSLVFIFLFLISALKPKAVMHLFVPGMLLLISTAICSYFYLFEQNWFFTIIYEDYLGWGYLAYIGIVFAFLCDVVFNKGRITAAILNLLFQAIGSALTALPC